MNTCHRCGQVGCAGITHVCPNPAVWRNLTQGPLVVTSYSRFVDTGIATVTTGGETSA